MQQKIPRFRKVIILVVFYREIGYIGLQVYMSSLPVRIDLRNIRDGEHVVLKGALPPSYLDLPKDEATVFGPIQYNLKVLLVEDHLLVTLDLQGNKKDFCRVCNQEMDIEIQVEKAMEMLPMEEIKTNEVDFLPLINQLFLLEAFDLSECNSGHCPKRNEIESYLNQKRRSSSPFDRLL